MKATQYLKRLEMTRLRPPGPRKRITQPERAAVVALFSNLPAKRRRLTLRLLWYMTPRSQRHMPGLRAARRFAPYSVMAEAVTDAKALASLDVKLRPVKAAAKVGRASRVAP